MHALKQSVGRTPLTDANARRNREGDGGSTGTAQSTSARPYAALRLLVSSCVERGGDQLLSPLPASSVSPEPSTSPVRDYPSAGRGSPPRVSTHGPRPVLTPAAAALDTVDFPAPRGKVGRLRPLSPRLRNSLDRSRESVAEEVVERLCSSRLLRRTTMVSRCRSRNPRRGREVPSSGGCCSGAYAL